MLAFLWCGAAVVGAGDAVFLDDAVAGDGGVVILRHEGTDGTRGAGGSGEGGYFAVAHDLSGRYARYYGADAVGEEGLGSGAGGFLCRDGQRAGAGGLHMGDISKISYKNARDQSSICYTPLMPKFIVHGGKPLKGTVRVSGSKNAALPILAACLLTDQPCRLTNVPDIADTRLMFQILRYLGSEVSFDHGTVHMVTKKIQKTTVPEDLAKKMRASILLLGPLLARAGKGEIPSPGGCVLGKRPTYAHEYAFEKLGAKNATTVDGLAFRGKKLQAAWFNLPEQSVTATENALMAAALLPGETKIRMAAAEPHVVDLCEVLQKMGCKITGIGTHTLKITGVAKPKGITHAITSDYLEVGTLTIAALLTRGRVRIEGVRPDQLDSFWQKLEEIGADFFVGADYVETRPTKAFRAAKVQTAVFPGFPTDLQAPMGVLLTQATGVSQIFETLFEGRLNYLSELEKMGVTVRNLNPHQAEIEGPTALTGATVVSCDIRAGAAVLVAALAAKGTSEVLDIQYTDRGYERIDEKLRSLGADIERVA